jgi:hypothetical protein
MTADQAVRQRIVTNIARDATDTQQTTGGWIREGVDDRPQ